jgi:hypothetical protein
MVSIRDTSPAVSLPESGGIKAGKTLENPRSELFENVVAGDRERFLDTG